MSVLNVAVERGTFSYCTMKMVTTFFKRTQLTGFEYFEHTVFGMFRTALFQCQEK